jgi:hypothetical protein
METVPGKDKISKKERSYKMVYKNRRKIIQEKEIIRKKQGLYMLKI